MAIRQTLQKHFPYMARGLTLGLANNILNDTISSFYRGSLPVDFTINSLMS